MTKIETVLCYSRLKVKSFVRQLKLKAKKEKNRGVATAQSKSTPLWQDLKRAVQMNACKLQLTKARSELKLLHSDARD